MTRFAKYTKDGTTLFYPEQTADSQRFDGAPVSTLPPGAVVARVASREGQFYLPTNAKRVLNFSQFGTTENTAQLYGMSMDFRPAEIPHSQWYAWFNRVSKFASDQVDGSNKFSDVPDFRKVDNSTESSMHGPLEGHGYWAKSFTFMEQWYWDHVPAYGPGVHWWANIETSNYWSRDYYKNDDGSGGISHYPRWIDVKGDSIDLESDAAISFYGTTTCSLETLFSNSGIQQIEAGVRRANRNSLYLVQAKRNGAWVGFGSAIVQGEPNNDALTGSGRFLDEQDANVKHVPGYTGTPGNVVVNGRTYSNLTGSFYKHETFHVIYNYYFTFDTIPNYDSIPDYPTLWPLIHNRHRIAYELSVWLGVNKRLKDVHNGVAIPTSRQHELFYEGNYSRVPSAIGTPLGDGGLTKVWIPPLYARIMRVVHHFCEGEQAGSMLHVFNSEGAPNQGIVYDLSGKAKYNHHLHTVEAFVAAGRDMETILEQISGSTLTTTIDIKIGGSGSFVSVNPVQAYSHGSDGSNGTLLPTFVTRHKMTAEGLLITFIGGMDQPEGTTRTDIISIPSVGNGNTIKCTYKGPDIQIFTVLFPNGVSNTEFEAKSIVSAWTRPGYGGLINNS